MLDVIVRKGDHNTVMKEHGKIVLVQAELIHAKGKLLCNRGIAHGEVVRVDGGEQAF